MNPRLSNKTQNLRQIEKKSFLITLTIVLAIFSVFITVYAAQKSQVNYNYAMEAIDTGGGVGIPTDVPPEAGGQAGSGIGGKAGVATGIPLPPENQGTTSQDTGSGTGSNAGGTEGIAGTTEGRQGTEQTEADSDPIFNPVVCGNLNLLWWKTDADVKATAVISGKIPSVGGCLPPYPVDPGNGGINVAKPLPTLGGEAGAEVGAPLPGSAGETSNGSSGNAEPAQQDNSCYPNDFTAKEGCQPYSAKYEESQDCYSFWFINFCVPRKCYVCDYSKVPPPTPVPTKYTSKCQEGLYENGGFCCQIPEKKTYETDSKGCYRCLNTPEQCKAAMSSQNPAPANVDKEKVQNEIDKFFENELISAIVNGSEIAGRNLCGKFKNDAECVYAKQIFQYKLQQTKNSFENAINEKTSFLQWTIKQNQQTDIRQRFTDAEKNIGKYLNANYEITGINK